MTLMLWSPNIEYPGIGNRYIDFFPGEQSVDAVGLSIYSKMFNLQTPPTDFVASVQGKTFPSGTDFHQEFAVKFNKPLVIPETSAPTCSEASLDQELNWKRQWWKQLFSEQTQRALPNLLGAVWFEIEKDGLHYGIFDRPDSISSAFISDIQQCPFVLFAPDMNAGFANHLSGSIQNPPANSTLKPNSPSPSTLPSPSVSSSVPTSPVAQSPKADIGTDKSYAVPRQSVAPTHISNSGSSGPSSNYGSKQPMPPMKCRARQSPKIAPAQSLSVMKCRVRY